MSNEWLTTGMMIDRLKVGEVAQSNDDVQAWYTEDYFLFSGTNKAEGDCYNFQLDPKDYTGDRQWRILPNYVSLEKAKEAILNGKGATFHPKGAEPIRITSYHMVYALYQHKNVSFGELFGDNWEIEDDTNA